MDAMGIRMAKHSVEQELDDVRVEIQFLENKLRTLNIHKLKLERELEAFERLKEI